MRPKLNIRKSVNFTQELYDKIIDAAKQLNVSFGAIIRGCVQNDLDKLIAREKAKTKRRTQEKITTDKHRLTLTR